MNIDFCSKFQFSRHPYKPVVVSMFTNRFSLPQSSKLLVALSLLTKRSAFPPLTIQFSNSSNGFSTMIAMMSVWNPQVNTGFLSLIFLKMISMLSLPIPNGLRQLKATKMTQKILNGLETYSVLDLSEAVTFPAKKFAF